MLNISEFGMIQLLEMHTITKNKQLLLVVCTSYDVMMFWSYDAVDVILWLFSLANLILDGVIKKGNAGSFFSKLE